MKGCNDIPLNINQEQRERLYTTIIRFGLTVCMLIWSIASDFMGKLFNTHKMNKVFGFVVKYFAVVVFHHPLQKLQDHLRQLLHELATKVDITIKVLGINVWFVLLSPL